MTALAANQEHFAKLGLNILRAKEHRYKIRFQELGHLVYQLAATPWTIPGFTVVTHAKGLGVLENMLSNGSDLEFTAGYYLLEVEKGI